MEKRSFRYVRFDTKEGRGYACICYTFERKIVIDVALATGSSHEVSYTAGVSFCSPRDFFKKNIARMKAENRFDLHSKFNARLKSVNKHVAGRITVPAPKTNHLSHYEFSVIFADILGKIGQVNSLPKWAKDSYRTGDFVYGLSELAVPENVADLTSDTRPKGLSGL